MQGKTIILTTCPVILTPGSNSSSPNTNSSSKAHAASQPKHQTRTCLNPSDAAGELHLAGEGRSALSAQSWVLVTGHLAHSCLYCRDVYTSATQLILVLMLTLTFPYSLLPHVNDMIVSCRTNTLQPPSHSRPQRRRCVPTLVHWLRLVSSSSCEQSAAIKYSQRPLLVGPQLCQTHLVNTSCSAAAAFLYAHSMCCRRRTAHPLVVHAAVFDRCGCAGPTCSRVRPAKEDANSTRHFQGGQAGETLTATANCAQSDQKPTLGGRCAIECVDPVDYAFFVLAETTSFAAGVDYAPESPEWHPELQPVMCKARLTSSGTFSKSCSIKAVAMCCYD